jgi:hypothetical protein
MREDGNRRCYACRRSLPAIGFAVDRAKASGRKSICRACDRAKSAAYYVAHLETKRAKARERARAPAAAKRGEPMSTEVPEIKSNRGETQ